MQYRTATLADLPHVLAMRSAFLKELYPGLDDKELDALLSPLPEYCRRHMGKDFFAFLAFEGDKPVSSVYLCINEQPANLRIPTGKAAVVLNVYTGPGFRRRGLASALLQNALAEAKARGVSTVELQATDMGAAVYERLGFKARQSHHTPMEYRFDPPDDSTAAFS